MHKHQDVLCRYSKPSLGIAASDIMTCCSLAVQGQASVNGARTQQAGGAVRQTGGVGGGVLSIAEQAAQMAAKRGRPAAAQSQHVTQSVNMVR